MHHTRNLKRHRLSYEAKLIRMDRTKLWSCQAIFGNNSGSSMTHVPLAHSPSRRKRASDLRELQEVLDRLDGESDTVPQEDNETCDDTGGASAFISCHWPQGMPQLGWW